MRSLAVFGLLAGLALPLSATEPISVHDLVTKLSEAHGNPDGRLAKHLYDLKLTERLSTERLRGLEAELPGEESRKALLALADSSAFLDLPVQEIPGKGPLDPKAQKELLEKSVDYVKKQIPLWPDFMATENEIQFSDVPARAPKKPSNAPYEEKLHVVYESTAAVRFLGGREELAPGPARGKKDAPRGATLSVQGVFGPIFSVVLKDVLVSHLSWSHWEARSVGLMAVFRYQVPADSSHYVVQDSGGQGDLAPYAGYHGEIGLDPLTGAILRLTLLAELHPNRPVGRADILIEYGPQKLGPETYMCPVKSVAVSLARDIIPLEGLYTYPISALPPFKLELSDTAYSEYHLFRTEMRILPGESATDGATGPPVYPQR